MNPVEWKGKADFKEIPDAELGTRLYASKKTTFKGISRRGLRFRSSFTMTCYLADLEFCSFTTGGTPLKTSNSTNSCKLLFQT